MNLARSELELLLMQKPRTFTAAAINYASPFFNGNVYQFVVHCVGAGTVVVTSIIAVILDQTIGLQIN